MGVNGILTNTKKQEKTRKTPEIVRFREFFFGGEGGIRILYIFFIGYLLDKNSTFYYAFWRFFVVLSSENKLHIMGVGVNLGV